MSACLREEREEVENPGRSGLEVPRSRSLPPFKKFPLFEPLAHPLSLRKKELPQHAIPNARVHAHDCHSSCPLRDCAQGPRHLVFFASTCNQTGHRGSDGFLKLLILSLTKFPLFGVCRSCITCTPRIGGLHQQSLIAFRSRCIQANLVQNRPAPKQRRVFHLE